MSYPHAIATGNAVIAAAVAYVSAHDHLLGATETAERAGALWGAVYAHVTTTAIEHTQGPDIDKDEKP